MCYRWQGAKSKWQLARFVFWHSSTGRGFADPHLFWQISTGHDRCNFVCACAYVCVRVAGSLLSYKQL